MVDMVHYLSLQSEDLPTSELEIINTLSDGRAFALTFESTVQNKEEMLTELSSDRESPISMEVSIHLSIYVHNLSLWSFDGVYTLYILLYYIYIYIIRTYSVYMCLHVVVIPRFRCVPCGCTKC